MRAPQRVRIVRILNWKAKLGDVDIQFANSYILFLISSNCSSLTTEN